MTRQKELTTKYVAKERAMGIRLDTRLHIYLLSLLFFSIVAGNLFLFLRTKFEQEETTSFSRGVDYLLGQQSDDGLWRSTTYGNLKDGAAMTAFVLYSLPLDRAEANDDYRAKLQSAVDALMPEVLKHGFVTNPDGPDYTNYGSAMLLLAADRLNLTLAEEAKTKLIEYLLRSQLDLDEGFDDTNPDFGGWDLSGWVTGQRPTTGSNISVTASVVEALAMVRESEKGRAAIEKSLAWQKLLVWLKRVNNSGGGFYFHPKQDHDGNKAGWADGNERQSTRSYGSATADGLRMLGSLGKTKEDAMVASAIAWFSDGGNGLSETELDGEGTLRTVPGFDHESGEASWAVGLRYYYYQSLSHSLDLFPTVQAVKIAHAIIAILESEQTADGSWVNSNARMREDDPLIATGFALIAIRNCKRFLDSL